MLGGVLVGVVLFLFLLDLRTAFISFISIPLSLLAAVIVLYWHGVSINTITLGGFAIAIGVVVDDAIIDVENILRRLRENALQERPRSVFQVVLDASLEVRSAVVYATFIVALVFVPVLTMGGVQGRLFAPLGVAFILATLASLGVALTVTPALCYVLLSRATPRAEPACPLAEGATSALAGRVARRPRTVLGLALLLCAGAVAVLPFFGGEFLPEFREGHYILHMAAVPGPPWPSPSGWANLSLPSCSRTPMFVPSPRKPGGPRTARTPSARTTASCTWICDRSAAKRRSRRSRNPRYAGQVSGPLLQGYVLPGRAHGGNHFRHERRIRDQYFRPRPGRAGPEGPGGAAGAGEHAGAVDVTITAQPGLPEMSVRLRPDRLLQYGFAPVACWTPSRPPTRARPCRRFSRATGSSTSR